MRSPCCASNTWCWRGHIDLGETQRGEVERLWGGGGGAARVGLDADARPSAVHEAALAGVERWRAVAGSPMSDRRMIEAAEIVSRAYEEIYAAAQ